MMLTRAECVKILENLLKRSNVQLLDYRIESENSAVGYLGEYYALTLSYAAPETPLQQSKLFIKALPQKSAEIEKEAIFGKEAWLYETLLADMQKYSSIKWCPNCYYTRPDLCVLEHVRLAGFGAAAGTQLDQPQVLQVLRALAAFHAASLVYEQRTQRNIGAHFADHLQEISVAADIAWFSTGLAAVLSVLRTLPAHQSPEQVAFINTQLPGILSGIYAQVGPSTKYRNVLCHRDSWAGNVFFAAAPDAQAAALLVDFQTCRYSPPAIDLSFSLHMNLDSEQRSRLESVLIEAYYDWLSADLQQFGLDAAEQLSKTELLQSYEQFRLFGLVYRAVAATIIKVPPHYVTNEFKYVERSAAILQYMQENEEFALHMRDCCEQLMAVALREVEP